MLFYPDANSDCVLAPNAIKSWVQIPFVSWSNMFSVSTTKLFSFIILLGLHCSILLWTVSIIECARFDTFLFNFQLGIICSFGQGLYCLFAVLYSGSNSFISFWPIWIIRYVLSVLFWGIQCSLLRGPYQSIHIEPIVLWFCPVSSFLIAWRVLPWNWIIHWPDFEQKWCIRSVFTW